MPVGEQKAEVSKGAWWDSKAGKVVASEPEEGVQIVAPGMELTDALKAELDRYKAGVADETLPDAITTESAKAPAKKG